MGKANVGRIATILKGDVDPFSLGGSLSKIGRQRLPGAIVILPPHREVTGEYRTGLDPNAKYIKDLAKKSPEAAELEKERVSKELERILSMIDPNTDLGPRSPFYANMNKLRNDGEFVCEAAKLKEGVNIFNLDNPMEAIIYAYVRVLPEVAPSYAAWKEGRCSPSVSFYVDDEDFEAEVNHRDNLKKAEALSTAVSFSPEKQRKIARLLGRPVTLDSKPGVVFNELFKFINDTNTRVNNVNLFNAVANLSDSDITIKYLVEEAITHNIYRINSQRVYEGEVEVAKNKEALISFLRDPEHSEDLLALEEKLNYKRLAIV